MKVSHPLMMALALGIGGYVLPAGSESVTPILTEATAASDSDHSLSQTATVTAPLAVSLPSDFDPAHLEWCSERYRSYNPRDNTWVSYDGRVRECDSPFW